MPSNCSGPCETCAIFVSGVTCLAGHGDDDYVPVSTQKAAQIGMNDLTLLLAQREIEMDNNDVREVLRNQCELLTYAHSHVTALACRINSMLLQGDEKNREKPGNGEVLIKWAERKFDDLLSELAQQAARVGRVRDEIEQLRNKIRVG